MVAANFKLTKTGDWWIDTLFKKHALTFGQDEFDKVAKELAKQYKKEVLNTLKTEGRSSKANWDLMAPSTRATKRGRKLLLDTYKLRKSLKIWKSDGGYYVGYRRGTTFNDRGVDMATIAQGHEEGRTVRILVTKAMVAAFMAKLVKYGKTANSGSGKGKMKVGSVMVIKIPARSFLGSTYDAHFKGQTVDKKAMAVLKDVSPLIRGLFKHIRL